MNPKRRPGEVPPLPEAEQTTVDGVAGPPVYHVPMPESFTRVEPVPAGESQVIQLGPAMTPEQATAWRESRRRQPDRLTGPLPPPEIIECYPAPRVQLVVVLRVDPGADPVKLTLSTAHFVSAVYAADRKLRLTLDPRQSHTGDGEVTLVLAPALLGAETAGRLEKVIGVVREAASGFDGATLARVEVRTCPGEPRP